jgi:hypothetical protein
MVSMTERKPLSAYPSQSRHPDFVNLKRAGHKEMGMQFNGKTFKNVCNIYGVCYIDGEKYFVTDLFRATLQSYIQDSQSQSLGKEEHLIHTVTRLMAEVFNMLSEVLQDIQSFIAVWNTNQLKMFLRGWKLSPTNILLDSLRCEHLTVAAIYEMDDTDSGLHELDEQNVIDMVFFEKILVQKAADTFFQILCVALGMNTNGQTSFDKSESSKLNALTRFVLNTAKVPPRMCSLLVKCLGHYDTIPNLLECQKHMEVVMFTRALPLQSPVSNHQFLLKDNVLCMEEWDSTMGSIAFSGHENLTENEMDPFEQWKRHRPCSSEVLAILAADELKHEPSLLYCKWYFVKYSLDSHYKALCLCRMLASCLDHSQGEERLQYSLSQLKQCLKNEALKDYQVKSLFQNLQFALDSEFMDLCKILQNNQFKNLVFNQGGCESFWTKFPLQKRLQEHRDHEAYSFSALFTNNAVETAFGKLFVLVFVFFVGVIICVGGVFLVFNTIQDGNFNQNAYNIEKQE